MRGMVDGDLRERLGEEILEEGIERERGGKG